MRIESIYIKSFGKLTERVFEFAPGINIVRGANEAGKSTICAFIKFIFYGLPSKTEDKLRYFNWNSSVCSGNAVIIEGDERFRIEREVSFTKSQDGKYLFRERANVYKDGVDAPFMRGGEIGEFFFGVPQGVFDSTCFIGQLDESRIGGASLCDAAENILFSADESINTKKAIKKLDDARTYLRYKKGRGGKIAELEDELGSVSEALVRAESESEEIIDLQGSLRTISKMKSDDEAKLKKVQERLDCYERWRVKCTFLHGREEIEKIKEIDNRISEYESSFKAQIYTEEYADRLKQYSKSLNTAASRLDDAQDRVDDAEKRCSEIQERITRFEKFSSKEFRRDEVVSELRHIHTVYTKIGMFTGILLGAAALFAVLAGMSYFFNAGSPALYGCAAVSALAFIAFAVFGITHSVYRHKLKILCRYFKCDTYKEFEELIAAVTQDEPVVMLLSETRDQAYERRNALSDSLRSISGKIDAELNSAGFAQEETTQESLEKAISDCAAAKAEIDKFMAVRREHEKNVEAVNTELSRYTKEYVDEASSEVFDEEQMQAFRYQDYKRLDYTLQSSVSSRAERIRTIETRLSALNASSPDPSALAAKKSELSTMISVLDEKCGAYELAVKALTDGASRLRDGISPRLAKNTSAVISSLTDSKYDKVGVNSDFNMFFSDGNDMHSVDLLSAGTADVTYLALRIALIEVLYKKSAPPFIFDESFSRLDDVRFTNALTMLMNISQDSPDDETENTDDTQNITQCLLFTCHGREERIMKKLGQYATLTI